MLKELRLNNFKSWHDTGLLRLGCITGLFGTNSSGKSSILQSLLLLKQTLESPDRSLPLHLGGEKDYVELGLYRDLIWGHDIEETLQIDLKWDFQKSLEIENPEDPTAPPLFQGTEMEFLTKIGSPNGEKLRVRNLAYTFSGQMFSLMWKEKGNLYQLSPTKPGLPFRFIRTPGRSWDLPQPVKFHGFPDQAVTYFQNSGFLPDLQRQLEEQFSSLYYLGPLREFPHRRYIWSGSEPEDVGRRGERAVDAILAARERKEYIKRGYRKSRWSLDRMLAYRLKDLGLIYDFSVERVSDNSNIYEVRVQRTPGAAKVLVTDVGFGVSQVLPVLVLCYYVDEGSTIIFEQPEIHLHPSVQNALADIFIDVAKHRNVQIIVESHSEHLLNRLQRRLAEEIITPEDVAFYFCEAKSNSGKLDPLETDQYGNIRNWPPDFFGDRFGEVAARQEKALERQLREDGEDR